MVNRQARCDHHQFNFLDRKSSLKKGNRPLTNQCDDHWQWSIDDKSEKAAISECGKTVDFYLNWSDGTAGARGTKPINLTGKYYWEVLIKDRVFGTSMMIGLTTKRARLQSSSYTNLIGENQFGWGLSHKGLIWYNGQWKEYTKPFRENHSTLVGCLYDGQTGTLTFFKDGENLGIAFTGINLVNENLYPTVSSTAAQSKFILICSKREYQNLQDRCRQVLNQRFGFKNQTTWNKYLPKQMISYLNFEEELAQIKFQNERYLIRNNQNNNQQNKKTKRPLNVILVKFKRSKVPMPDF